MIKVLIAYNDKTFTKELKDRLSPWHNVEVCHDGGRVLDCCRKFEPQLLIIDLEMPGMDGLSILSILRSSGREMDVLAIGGCVLSWYHQQKLVALGVCQYMLKPCTMEAVAFSAHEIICMNSVDPENESVKDMNVLIPLGVNPKMVGYQYVCAAINLLRDNPGLQITKAIYPMIAEQFHVSKSSVEHAMRHCIRKAWEKRNDAIWKQYFPVAQSGEVPCPTSGDFIARMTMCVKTRKIV